MAEEYVIVDKADLEIIANSAREKTSTTDKYSVVALAEAMASTIVPPLPADSPGNKQLVTDSTGKTKWIDQYCSKEESFVTLLEEQTLDFSTDQSSAITFEIEGGKKYTVTVDGTDYVTTALDAEHIGDIVIPASISISDIGLTINQYSFAFNDRGVHTVKISTVSETIKTLDDKFISKNIARSSEVIKTFNYLKPDSNGNFNYNPNWGSVESKPNIAAGSGAGSIIEGTTNAYTTCPKADGGNAHAEGSNSYAKGDCSHAEGRETTASGVYSHAEGYETIASNQDSHAEGVGTTASGHSSHAEGSRTTASGYYSHAEGGVTTASGDSSHAEGSETTAEGSASHAEGRDTTASVEYAHAEGVITVASGIASHAEGRNTTASGEHSHAEGINTTASGNGSHAEGCSANASASYSHAEGYYTTASGQYSHAEGYYTTASGQYSHAEGGSYDEDGGRNVAIDNIAGLINIKGPMAYGISSHAEGGRTLAYGHASHAEGYDTTASGKKSHVEGDKTIAASDYQHVQGKYNIEDADNKYAHIVGNGAGSANRSNAHTLDWSGNAWYAGTVEGTAMIVKSSTPNSTKRFKITVDDSGTISATEITT